MANVDGPIGLRPARLLGGGCIVQNAYSIASGYNTDLFAGDIVELTGTGTNIERSAAGSAQAIGVFAGCQYTDPQGEVKFAKQWPANQTVLAGTEVIAYVFDDPDIIFVGQCDTIAEADIGSLADWVVGTGNAASGRSATEIEGSAVAAINKSLRILRLVPEPGNEYGAHGNVEVLFAEHALKGVVAGVGGEA